MSKPDDDAGRKNVEALATETFSDCPRRFSRLLQPAGTWRSLFDGTQTGAYRCEPSV